MPTSKIKRKPRTSTSLPEPTLRYGDTLGSYVINGFAGKGSTSYVYEARPQDSFERLAIKVLHPHLLADPHKRRTFFREARIMMRMDHPNVVRFDRILEVDGHLAFVMEYVDGVTLDRWLADEAREADQFELACLFADILRGLSHAHGHGVVHRDIKPANVLIAEEDGRYKAKIIDFGLARLTDQPVSERERSKIAGTAAYISPEEVTAPDEVGHRSDLYSLGVMLYEAACGARPFDGGSPRQLLDAHAGLEPQPPSKRNPSVSPELEEVIMRTLSKRPDRRFESAPEMIEALERAIHKAMRIKLEQMELEQAPTTEWARPDDPDGPAGSPALFAYLMTCMRVMFTVLASTGAESGDAHHLNRDPRGDLHLPMG